MDISHYQKKGRERKIECFNLNYDYPNLGENLAYLCSSLYNNTLKKGHNSFTTHLIHTQL